MAARALAFACALVLCGSIAAAQPGGLTPAPSSIDNQQVTRVGGGVIEIRYDLVSDTPDALFTIALESSVDSGRTFSNVSTSLSGDLGPGVRPGASKRIVWTAHRDVDLLFGDTLQLRVVSNSASSRSESSGSVLSTRVTNRVVERVGRGNLLVSYDFASQDADAVFNVSLVVSDGERTFSVPPGHATGDIGPRVRPGAGRRIEWQASRDLDMLLFDRVTLEIKPERVLAAGGLQGELKLTSEPSGAAVYVDGQSRGRTPLGISLSEGLHHIVVGGPSGYADEVREISVKAGDPYPLNFVLRRNFEF